LSDVRPLSHSTAVGSGDAVVHDAFSALDATPGVRPTWQHATARNAEAGFQDPALGWIGVRADRGDGGVHAVLVPGTPHGALELGKHMEGIQAYLSEQHTQLASLKIDAPGTFVSGVTSKSGLGLAAHGEEQVGLQAGMRDSDRGSGQSGKQQNEAADDRAAQPGAGQTGTGQSETDAGGPDKDSRSQASAERVTGPADVAGAIEAQTLSGRNDAHGKIAWQRGEHISLVA